MAYLGDFAEDATVYTWFSTNDSSGGRVAFSAALETADFEVIKDGSTTGSTAGITITTDFDSKTGIHKVEVDMSADAFYTTASDYALLMYPDETVDSQSVAAVIAEWSCENRFDQVDVTRISGDTAAANNLESDYDGTGYNKSNSTVGTVTTLTGHTAQTGDSYARIGADGAGLTAIAWNSAWDAEVQSEVQDAIEANHLDHLFAADYDPASPPGSATALLNELVESNGGVARFTANALEEAAQTSVTVASIANDAVSAGALSQAAADKILDTVIESEGSYTLQQAASIMLAVLAGETSNSGNTISTPNGNATRVAATTSSNERTAMTLTPSS